LQETANPRVGQVDLDFFIRHFTGSLDIEARRVDLELRILVRAYFLEFVVECCGVIDVRRSTGKLADVFENFVTDTQPTVTRLVLAETLEENFVGVYCDNRVENYPRISVLSIEIIEVFLTSAIKCTSSFFRASA